MRVYNVKINKPYSHISLDLYSDITDLYYANTGLSDREIASAISRGQIFSKQWMIQELQPYLPDDAHIVIFGSWIGLAARLLFEQLNDQIATIACIELDGRMDKPSWHLNYKYSDKFKFFHSDVFEFDLNAYLKDVPFEKRVFINCSCDNIDSTERYVEAITPLASVNVLQQNNYQSERSHLSVNSIDEFKTQVKQLKHQVFFDTLSFSMYDRYMVISKQ